MSGTALHDRSRRADRRALRFVRAMLDAIQLASGRKAGNAAARYALTEGLETRRLMSTGAVFVATNHNNTQDPAEPANEVVMYDREENGTLSVAGRFATGGQGSGPSIRFAGDGLGSAHSVQLSQDKKFLFVTNAGSDNLTVFRVSRLGLTRTDLEQTGDFPNSVTQSGNRVYVLNAAGQGSISGYRLSSNGTLTPIPGSTRVINANQDLLRPDTLFNPAEVSFTPDGRKLVVTIKDGPAAGAIPGVTPTGKGRVLVFNVGSDGKPSANFTQTNLGNQGPFGFSFDSKGNLLTSLFVGGPNLTAAAGSFKINSNNTLTAISRNVPNTQLDSCWIENNGKYAYTANYTSGTISSYRVGSNGSLTLLKAVAGTTDQLPGGSGYRQGSTPLDIRVNPSGDFLYNVLPGSGSVAGWKINSDGSLTKVGEFGGVPRTVNGDAAPVEYGPGGSPAGIDAVDFSGSRPGPKNVVYVMTNDPRTGKNAVLAYRRDANTGALTRLGEYRTGGKGYENVDDRIGPDDSDQELVISRDRRFLFAVNQGSDTVSVFRVRSDGSLSLVPGGPFDSGGKQPVSVGLTGDTVIVVNKGDQNPGGSGGSSVPNYTSFRLSDEGRLRKIRGSTVEVAPGSSPTQALISRDGQFVFGDNFLTRPIPELAPFVPAFGSELESFKIGADGQLSDVPNSPIPSPLTSLPDQYILGLQVHPTRRLVYTGFVVGNKLGVFSYDNKGTLKFQKAISLKGAGACWIVINKEGTRLYATNFSTNSVAVVNIEDPLNPVEMQDLPLGGPHTPHVANPPSPAMFNTVAFQLSLSDDGKFLYVLNHEQAPDNSFPEGNQVNIFKVQPDGTLTQGVNSTLILPQEFVPANAHPQGIVAI